MLYSEAKQFVENVLSKLWSDWTPEEALLQLWCKALYPFDWQIAKIAAENVKMNHDFKEPKMAAFRKEAYNLIPKKIKKAIPIPDYKVWYFDTKNGSIKPVIIDPTTVDHPVELLSRIAHTYIIEHNIENTIVVECDVHEANHMRHEFDVARQKVKRQKQEEDVQKRKEVIAALDDGASSLPVATAAKVEETGAVFLTDEDIAQFNAADGIETNEFDMAIEEMRKEQNEKVQSM